MLKSLLLSGAEQMGVPMTEDQASQFARYHAMLVEANARMNLTRVPDDPREAADRNYLDCISPLAGGFPVVRIAVDVGSGEGFPGVPLSIMLPQVRFTLVDALGKRVEFLRAVIDALGLNAEALHLRAEDAARKDDLRERFDLATARAVAPMNVLCEYLLPFVRVGGYALCWKGPGVAEEMQDGSAAAEKLGGVLEAPVSLSWKGENHLLSPIRKTALTLPQYPRKNGIPAKRPLKKDK